jgi:hypothetical protein
MPDQVRQHKILAASLSLPKTEPPLSNSMVAVLLHPRDPALEWTPRQFGGSRSTSVKGK